MLIIIVFDCWAMIHQTRMQLKGYQDRTGPCMVIIENNCFSLRLLQTSFTPLGCCLSLQFVNYVHLKVSSPPLHCLLAHVGNYLTGCSSFTSFNLLIYDPCDCNHVLLWCYYIGIVSMVQHHSLISLVNNHKQSLLQTIINNHYPSQTNINTNNHYYKQSPL